MLGLKKVFQLFFFSSFILYLYIYKYKNTYLLILKVTDMAEQALKILYVKMFAQKG